MGASELAEADDADLVRALGQDPGALEEFYRRHVRTVTRFAMRWLGDPHSANDLVAATFLAVIESADRFDPRRGEAAAWLYGIARNLHAGQQRRFAAESRALSRFGGQRDLPPDEYGRVVDRVDARRRIGPLRRMLRILPAAEWELVSLVVQADLTVREAAAALGIRPGTARMRWFRARARLAAAARPG